MAKKIVYLIPGLHFPSGMERVLTLKANYLADEFGYDVTVILTEEKDKPFYYPLSPKVKTINFDLNLTGCTVCRCIGGWFITGSDCGSSKNC